MILKSSFTPNRPGMRFVASSPQPGTRKPSSNFIVSCSSRDGIINRRTIFISSITSIALLQLTSISARADQEFRTFNAATYSLNVPVSWDQKGKAGADSLFEDPEKRSTNVGVTQNPVRVESIEKFGTLEFVGQKLLDAEKAKESTLSVDMVRQGARSIDGVSFYDYEYLIDSTRGKKRIFNTVTITGSKLYILNGVIKCEKGDEACSGPTDLLMKIAESLRVKA